jgi:NTE family protein
MRKSPFLQAAILLSVLIALPSVHAGKMQDIFLTNDPIVIGEQAFKDRLSSIEDPVALVLSGGSARAFAHIGVLENLEQRKIVPDLIISNSMGSIIGILYAAGLSPGQIYTLFEAFEGSDQFSLRFPIRGGLISSKLTGSLIYQILGDIQLEDLPIPIMIICEDLITGRQIRITSGEAYRIMQAAYALPVYFDPVPFDDYLLIDGGFSNLVPVGAASVYANTIIASTTFYQNPDLDLANPLTILNRAVDITKSRKAVEQIEALNPYLIRCEVEEFSFMAFDRLDELVETGYRSAQKVTDLPKTGGGIQTIRDLAPYRSSYEHIVTKQILDYQAFDRIPERSPVGTISVGVLNTISPDMRRQLQQRFLGGLSAQVESRNFKMKVITGGSFSLDDQLKPGLSASAELYPTSRIRISALTLFWDLNHPEYYAAAAVTAVPYLTITGNRAALHAGLELSSTHGSLLTIEGEGRYRIKDTGFNLRGGYTLEDETSHALYAELGLSRRVADEISLHLHSGGAFDPTAESSVSLRPLDATYVHLPDFGPWIAWHTASFRFEPDSFSPTFAELLICKELWTGVYGEIVYTTDDHYWSAGIEGSMDISFIGLASANIRVHVGYQSSGNPLTGGISLAL